MGKRQMLMMGIAAGLPLLLGACSVNLGSTETSYNDKVPQPSKPYQCTDGDWDGPGVINGQKLTGQGRLSKSLVFLVHQLSTGSDSASLCTGTLISRDVVLTAAHCVDGGLESTRAERLAVIFGNDPLCSLSKKETGKIRKAEKIVLHPEWSTTNSGGVDLALVKLSSDSPWETTAMDVAIDLPSLDDDREIFGAGYGRTTDYDDQEGDQPYLRIAKLRPQNRVPNQGIMNNPASRRLIFNQKDGGSLCRGDSGGPAIVVEGGKAQIVGVASYVWDPTVSTCKSYVVHTSVAYYREWLMETYEKMRGTFSAPNPFRR